MASVTLTSLGLGSVASVTSVTPSCTRYFDILGPPPLCFLFFVFPSHPLPLTPRAGYLTGNQKHLPQVSSSCRRYPTLLERQLSTAGS